MPGQRVVWSAAKLTREHLQPRAVGAMNGRVIGFFPSSVFQDIHGHTPDFQSASAATTYTAFHHHTAKHCPVDGWWSRHRGCRLLWEWYYQVRKLSIIVNRPGVLFNVRLQSSAQHQLFELSSSPFHGEMGGFPMSANNGKCKALPGLSHSLEGIPRASSASQGCFTVGVLQLFLCIP